MAGVKTLIVLALVSLSGIQSAPTTPDPGCGQNPADIVFLLDSSGSVGSSNFQKQLDFVSKFANSFDIGPNAVQIGVTTFATTPRNEFWMNQHQNKPDLLKAIHNIRYHSGGTHTDSALNFVKSQAFTKAHGDRDKVANILIVMTDGKSQTHTQTVAVAQNIHKTTTWSVFAIGIGSSLSQDELQAIAGSPKNVFTVQNFDALKNIQAQLKKTACQIDGKWSKWGFYSPCTKACGGGTQYRERTCSNPPPSHGGKTCPGSGKETKACGTTPCTTTPKPTTKPPPTPGPTTTVAPGCGVQPADILFIVDSSGSVGATNFGKMLNFIETMVQGFDIGPNGIEVGMITFDNKPYLQFHLNKYHDKTSLINAIKNTKYTRGNTYTHLALQYALGTSFTAPNGARPNAAKIAIVITDGQSNNPTATKSQAQKLRDAGVTVFSVGVGNGIRQNELNAMATDPDSGHVFVVNNFDALKLIKSTLQKKACEVKPTIAATKAPPKPNCGAMADIVFLLDESGSVGKTNYNKMLDFVTQIADNFAIGPKDVQIGVETFSSTYRHQFFMNQYKDKASLETAIKKIPYHGGNTHTGTALGYVTDHSFTKAAGMRDGVPHIAFVLTDGNSQQRDLTKTNAAKLQAKGVKVFAVGIGNGINNAELNNIASNPDNQYVFRAANFDSLKNLKGMLSSKACEVAKPMPDNTTTPLPKDCGAKADIVFMLDSSGSVHANNFDLVLAFVKSIIQDFDIGQDKIRIGVEKFSTRPYLEFHLNQYKNKQDTLNAITNINYSPGGTNTGEALKYLKDNMFNSKNGDRPGVPNIGIVITDGRSNSPDQTKNMAKAARQAGIQLFSVGVGPSVSTAELNEIATDPDSGHVMTVNDFSKLPSIKALFAKKACAVIPPTLPPYVPTPETSHAPPIDPCQDAIVDCDRYPKTVCRDFVQWSEHNCQRTCGICATSIPTVPPLCKDMLPNCKSYNPTSCTGQYTNWAKENCRQYCGYCVPQAVTGYFGTCFYKNKQYKQGEKWQDGCQYDCECTDASQGQYQCYNKCPAYYNLPPQCTLVNVPNECCLKPVCDFEGSYETKSGQNVGTLNGNKVCVYDGKQYYQGQTWQIGCEFECKCDDAGVGLWSCQSVCAQYGALPQGCKLVQNPGDCCAKPNCEFSTQIGSFTGQGTISGTGDKTTPTTPGPCVDALSNCDSYAPDACTKFKPWAIDNCRRHCNLCVDALLPGPNDFCIYKGTQYKQGQRWTDGCNGECFCENAKYGYYRCNNACPKYYNVPPGCTVTKQNGQCCDFLSCPGGSFTGSSTVPGTVGSYPVPNPLNQPTPGTGLTPTSAPHLVPPQIDGCMYNGVLYKTGQRWYDACQYSCSCDDGTTGRFTCSPRCPTFSNLATGCVLKDVPNDPCCQFPDCSGAPAGTTVIPTYGPGFTGYGPAVYPTGLGPGTSGYGTTLAPLIPGQTRPPITGQRSGCLYQGRVYQKGEKWADGCQYNCECVDANTGFYRCTERCAHFQNLPSQCTLIPDPKDPTCCQTYKCDYTQSVTTPRPLFAVTTPQAGVDYCVYNGQYYRQGEEWNDGCSLVCRCEDAKNNYHQCSDRCAAFTNVPLGCKLVPDPKDPQCCKVPECDSLTGTATGTNQPLGFLGSFTGYGRPPNSNLPSQVGYRDACIYKGVIHQQGATWQDGCNLDCECLDAKSGRYRCTYRCPRYAALPAGCVLLQDPNDRCCQKAECAPPTTNGCVDKKANCYLYGQHSCVAPYTQWAKDNCASFCGFCGPKTTPNPQNCKDQIPNCNEYNKDSCVGEYTDWARFNCPKFCGYCGGQGPVTTPRPNIYIYGSTNPPPVKPSTCQDAISNCAQYTQASCHDPYLNWAITNCPRYCNLCDRVGTVPQATQGTVTIGGSGTNIHGTGPGQGSFVTEYPISGFTGFNTGCYYKGRVYKTGEAWADGCEYNCTCVNGQTGYYKCNAGCQTYQNLPQGCVLVKDPPTACCATPHCGGTGTGTGNGQTGIGSYTGTGQTGTGFHTGTGNGCYYKGTTYGQDQTWNDGCSLTCTCVDAFNSRYQCRQRCITWTLPAACTLEAPAAGKCCETPKCPAGYTLSYPPGYKDE